MKTKFKKVVNKVLQWFRSHREAIIRTISHFAVEHEEEIQEFLLSAKDFLLQIFIDCS